MRLAYDEELRLAEVKDLEERLRVSNRRRIQIAFAGAVLLHASTALGLVSWETEPVAPPGEMVITIDLAPAMMSAEAEPIAGQSAESAPQQETPPEPEPTPEEEVVEEEPPPPEPVQEEPPPEPVEVEEKIEEPPPPEPVEVEESIEPPPPAEEAEVVVAPKPKPRPKNLKPKPKPKPKPPAPAQAASSARAKKADVGGSGARANPSDLAKYIGRLRSALERRKRYPAAAGGASGTASLRFTVNRNGQVTGFTLTRSSGNPALDAAARAMVQGANLPAIPEGLPNSITVGVPVNFRVR